MSSLKILNVFKNVYIPKLKPRLIISKLQYSKDEKGSGKGDSKKGDSEKTCKDNGSGKDDSKKSDSVKVFKDKKGSRKSGKVEKRPKKTSKKEIVVPGLSTKVLKVPNKPVGPGASKCSKYKNPEYYCYHKYSVYDAFVELHKYRCFTKPKKCK